MFSLVNSAVDMTLPEFAAERRAAAQLLPVARRCRSISFARTTLSSKPAACRCCARLMGQTDGRTPDRFIDPAPHTMRTVSKSASEVTTLWHCRSISFARTTLSSKPAACRCCVRLMGQTDGWTPDYVHSVTKRLRIYDLIALYKSVYYYYYYKSESSCQIADAQLH